MKKVLALTLCIAILGCLGSCTIAAAQEDVTTLRIMWWGSQARHEKILKVLELYEQQNPHIKFQPEYMSVSDYFAKLNTLVAANDLPDICAIGNNLAGYMDYFEPLDTYVEAGLLDLSDTTEAFLAATRVDGKLVALSNGTNSWSVFYDPQLFEKAGVPLPTKDWTWQEFENDCYQISEKLGIYGTGEIYYFWPEATFLAQHGTDVLVYNDAGNDIGQWDDSMLTDYYRMLERLIAAPGAYPPPDVNASIKDIQGELIVTQKAAMAWLPSNNFPAVCNAAGRELKIAPYPRLDKNGPSGGTVRNTLSFAVCNTSEAKDECARFLSFFANSLEAHDIMKAEYGVPIMGKVRAHLMENAEYTTAEMIDFTNVMAEIASHPMPKEPAGQIEIEEMCTRLLERLSFQMITPEDAAKQFMNEVRDILKK